MRFSFASVLLGAVLVISAGGCGTPKGGQVPVDSPALSYQAPDIDELTGIEPPETAEDAETLEDEPVEGTAPAPAAPQSTK